MNLNDTTPPLSLPNLVFNLVLGLFVSLIVSWYYVKFGSSLSNRKKFAPVLPILTLITLLTITIVKSSLALSLGLVGALSIVRFRTAIKDPEELIFLFFSIAIGLGFGADQRIPTLVSVAIIMAYLFARTFLDHKSNGSHSVYLNIQVKKEDDSLAKFEQINQLLTSHLKEVDLRRMDNGEKQLQMTYYANIAEQEKLIRVMDALESAYPDCLISIVEQNNLLGG